MDETKPVLYRCDPSKHKECKKTNCFERGGECDATTHKEYAVQENGVPVILDWGVIYGHP